MRKGNISDLGIVVAPYDKNIEILKAKIARFALEEDVEKEGQE